MNNVRNRGGRRPEGYRRLTGEEATEWSPEDLRVDKFTHHRLHGDVRFELYHQRYAEAAGDPRHAHLKFVTLRTPGEVRAFLVSVT